METPPDPSRRVLAGLMGAAAVAAAGAAQASGAPKADKKKGGGESFLQLPTLTASVNGGNRRAILTVENGLDVPDDKLRDHAALSEPRLRAAFTQSLQLYASGLGPQALPDADYIARILQRDANRVLGRAGATLLLGTILVS